MSGTPPIGCSCVGVEIGTYSNQVELPRPPHMLGRSEGTASDTICVDACLADEVQHLWALGIVTTGCCCGHNTLPGYIGVVEEDVPRMKALGYAVAPNPERPGAEDSFVPRSVGQPAGADA